MDWRPIETAPDDQRVLVYFAGAGPIVAYRRPDNPDQWVRFLGYGKSPFISTIHADYATHWCKIDPPPRPSTPRGD
jgi:hypothetical protein